MNVASKLQAWIDAGDRAQDRYGYEGAGRMPIEADIRRLLSAFEALKAALEWYANPDIYKPHPHGIAFDNRDLSFRARAALANARKPR